MASVLLRALAEEGAAVTAYVPAQLDGRSDLELPGVEIVAVPTRWRYGKWYSRNDTTKFATGGMSRVAQLRRTGALIEHDHVRKRFDAVYQFSVPEMPALVGRRDALPPIVVHPETHAAAEREWLRSERRLIQANVFRAAVVDAALASRSTVQSRHLKLATRVIAPSRRFADLMIRDYQLASEAVVVIPNPIDLTRFQPSEVPRVGPQSIVFASRIAARKGVERVVDLSHRLDALAGVVVLDVFGDRSLFSDYRRLLDTANPRMLRYHGHVSATVLAEHVRRAAVLIQPSSYEPFALTVAEALASGVPVVTTSEVGATEDVDPRCSIRVDVDDGEGLADGVRRMLDSDRDAGLRRTTRALARSEAERLFAPAVVAKAVLRTLADAARQA